MASMLKGKIQQAAGGGDHTANEEEVEKYKLLVTAGPSYDLSQHEVVKVNQDQPLYVENDFIRAKVSVRVKGFEGRGLPSDSPASSPYFDDPDHAKDQYSIGFSFVPKQDIPSVDTVWGNDFDHPISKKLPPGFNTAFKIVKEFIDPGLSCDAYADEPWLYGPSLSCWFAFRVGEKVKHNANFPGPKDRDVMKEGGDGTGQDVRNKLGIPENGEKRRKHFLSTQHRSDFVFEKDRLYEADFFNPYIDFPNFSLKLPGFSLKVIKYIDQQSHCLRYVFKNRKTGDMYLNVNFRLLWGEQLQKALKNDQKHQQPQQLNAGNRQESQQAAGGAKQPDTNIRAKETKPKPQPSVDGPMLGPDAAPSERDAHPNTDMQLHPGDQSAAGDYNSESEVLSRLLQSTSTSDKTGSNVRILASDVD